MNQTPAPHRAQSASSDQNSQSNDNPIDLGALHPRSYSPRFLLGYLNSMIKRDGAITPADWNTAIERSQAFQSTQDDGAR